jgi:hypothetical protein
MKYSIPALLVLLAMLGRNNVAAAAEEKKSLLDDVATVGVGASAMGASLALRIPTQICKSVVQSVSDINEKVRNHLDLDDSPVSVAVASVPSLPAGTAYGLVEGAAEGTEKAVVSYRDLIDYGFWDHVGFNVK